MNSTEKQTVLHCLKSMIDEEVCEECPLYGTTGTDHCEKDCVRLAINALEQEPCDELDFVQPHKKISVNLELCDDAISRQAVLDKEVYTETSDGWTGWTVDVNDIKELPPVKPTEKVGYWITVDKGLKVTSYKCSECGRMVRDDTGYDVIKDYPYCHCGAKMGGEQE